MFAQISLGCDKDKTPSIVVRHNVDPVYCGRTVQVVGLIDPDDPKGAVIGVKQINCWKDGAGHATCIPLHGPKSIGRRKALDAAFRSALDDLERIGKKTSPDNDGVSKVAEKLRQCLVSESNEWPPHLAEVIAECSA